MHEIFEHKKGVWSQKENKITTKMETNFVEMPSKSKPVYVDPRLGQLNDKCKIKIDEKKQNKGRVL